MKKWSYIYKFDPLWYAIPIDGPGPGDDPPGPGGPGPGAPALPGLASYLRKRYTSNFIVQEEMTVADLINDVINPSCRAWQGTGPKGKIRMRNKKPVDYAYATAALSGTTASVDDASPWVASLARFVVVDPHTVNSEVKAVTSAVYPVAQNSTTLTTSHAGQIPVTAFSGAAGGSTPATATVTVSSFTADTVTYTITLDGVAIAFIASTADTTSTIAAFIAGAIEGDPRLSRRFKATVVTNVVTITAKFGTLTFGTALTMPHVAPVANPAVAPTLAAAGSGNMAAGLYRVAYAYHNHRGHTLLSPYKEITLTANQKINVSSITPPAGCTVVWYVSVEPAGTQIRKYLENLGASHTIDKPLPKKTASMAPAFNRTGAEIMRVTAVYSDRAEERSAIGASNVLKATFKWQLGNKRKGKNVVELTYRHASADYRLVTLRERDDDNIAKVLEKRVEKINGTAIDTYFQAKRISTGVLAEILDAAFYYTWSSTQKALLNEEGDVVVVTDGGSGVINLPVWIEERELEADRAGMPSVSFTAHKYYSTLYDDSVNETLVPIISEL